ncbi:transposase [Tunicatimonas sp.]|uniref:transposase n=1 Tax=Tunicatimonas sp. TaxID=1940096 RepID=UPI003C72E848
MRNKTYSSDLSAKSWQSIEKLITVQRKSKWELKAIVDSILYLTKNGCVWRDLPCCFPPWPTVFWRPPRGISPNGRLTVPGKISVTA